MKYQGHKNKTHWNVSLYLFNEYGLYQMVKDYVKRCSTLDSAAEHIFNHLQQSNMIKTPDGFRYSKTAIRAALSGCKSIFT